MFKEVNTIDSNVDMDAIESIIATHINELIDELEFISSELGMTPLEYIYDDDRARQCQALFDYGEIKHMLVSLGLKVPDLIEGLCIDYDPFANIFHISFYDDDSVIEGDIVESESTNLIPQKIVKH